jgi:hypothetical protein
LSENSGRNNCDIVSTMEPTWIHKSAKCDEIVKQIPEANHEPKYLHKNDKPS